MSATLENVCAVVGDVVASREHDDRHLLQEALEHAFRRVAQKTSSVQPFTMTIGDEFQGIFEGVRDALAATLRLRLELFGVVDVRFGIGFGDVVMLGGGTAPYGQDGNAWWYARDAIDEVHDSVRRYGWPRTWRTAWKTKAPGFDAVRAYLMLRDQIVAGFDRDDVAIILALLDGDRQTEVADRLGLDRSAVSRRVSAHGISAILRAERGESE